MVRKTIGVILILVMMLIPAASFADEIEPGRDCSVTICSGDNVDVLEGMQFNLYKIAKLSRMDVYTFEDGYQNLGIEFTGANSDKWQQYADEIAEYISSRNIDPTDYAVADSTGTAKLPNKLDKLTSGIYLVTSYGVDVKDKVYTAHPYLISLPAEDNGTYIYDITSYPKVGEYNEQEEAKKLPQTGLLWWPCLALVVGGLLCIVIGLSIRKKNMYR